MFSYILQYVWIHFAFYRYPVHLDTLIIITHTNGRACIYLFNLDDRHLLLFSMPSNYICALWRVSSLIMCHTGIICAARSCLMNDRNELCVLKSFVFSMVSWWLIKCSPVCMIPSITDWTEKRPQHSGSDEIHYGHVGSVKYCVGINNLSRSYFICVYVMSFVMASNVLTSLHPIDDQQLQFTTVHLIDHRVFRCFHHIHS